MCTKLSLNLFSVSVIKLLFLSCSFDALPISLIGKPNSNLEIGNSILVIEDKVRTKKDLVYCEDLYEGLDLTSAEIRELGSLNEDDCVFRETREKTTETIETQTQNPNEDKSGNSDKPTKTDTESGNGVDDKTNESVYCEDLYEGLDLSSAEIRDLSSLSEQDCIFRTSNSKGNSSDDKYKSAEEKQSESTGEEETVIDEPPVDSGDEIKFILEDDYEEVSKEISKEIENKVSKEMENEKSFEVSAENIPIDEDDEPPPFIDEGDEEKFLLEAYDDEVSKEISKEIENEKSIEVEHYMSQETSAENIPIDEGDEPPPFIDEGEKFLLEADYDEVSKEIIESSREEDGVEKPQINTKPPISYDFDIDSSKIPYNQTKLNEYWKNAVKLKQLFLDKTKNRYKNKSIEDKLKKNDE